jgi:membrane-associated phospholipid phosphatase
VKRRSGGAQGKSLGLRAQADSCFPEAGATSPGSILLANLLGLIGFLLDPTAPPRLLPQLGFADTLDSIGDVNHGSGLVQLAANPYAAMPSLHAADALIVAIVLFAACRHRWAKALWLLWPAWVWFCVIATANHYLLDVLAGIALALVALTVVAAAPRLRRRH